MRGMRATLRPVAVALALTSAVGPGLSSARGDEDVAAFEHIFGATDVNAAIGNGGATAGFSAQGELTVLRWPSPSYFQHVNFKSSPDKGARAEPHFGAADNQGS